MSETTAKLDAIQARLDAAAPGAITILPSEVAWLRDTARKQQTAIDAVKALHVEEGNGNCVVCWDFNADADVKFPCPTIKALEANR
jgi:hypothetical protein